MAARRRFLERTEFPKWFSYGVIVLWILLLLGWLYATFVVVIYDD
jgi:hypothetical protein